jgi:hypothetical protein
LTDALSTTSLPGADREYLVVIRRLPLGRISARVSPASLALHIERVTERVMSGAVAYADASAGAADAVSFPDRGEAIVALARRHAAGGRTDEWFWSAVVPGWHADDSRRDRWSRVMDAAHESPEAAIVAAAVLDLAIRTRTDDELLSSIGAGRGVRWLRAAGWDNFTPQHVAAPWRPLTASHSAIVRNGIHQWGAMDDRLLWLAALLTVLEHPMCLGDPHLPARIAFGLREDEMAVTAGRESPGANRATRSDTLAQPSAAVEYTRSRPSHSRPGSIPDLSHRDHEPAPPTSTVDRTLERATVIRSAAEHLDGPSGRHVERLNTEAQAAYFTSFAGLLFVVPILQRLDFSSFLASQPAFLDGAFPLSLLRFIAGQAGLPRTDPLALALDAEIGDDNETPTLETGQPSFQMPARARAILTTPPPRHAMDSPYTVWLTAVRRWCRRRAGFGLTTLIRRPGHIHMTHTHLDARFTLAQLDLRVRRAALDVNPGWVPWIGRVIHFRYD